MSRPPERLSGLLVIVPGGPSKIWDKYPDAGPTAAADAYIGAPFTVNRRYAERPGGEWVVLSAKHGFLRPTDVVPGPYNTTFKRRSTNPIGVAALREQVEQMGSSREDYGPDPDYDRSGFAGYRSALAPQPTAERSIFDDVDC